MIRLLDQLVADWRPFIYDYHGLPIEQVEVFLFNGMLIIMTMDEFLSISSDEGWA